MTRRNRALPLPREPRRGQPPGMRDIWIAMVAAAGCGGVDSAEGLFAAEGTYPQVTTTSMSSSSTSSGETGSSSSSASSTTSTGGASSSSSSSSSTSGTGSSSSGAPTCGYQDTCQQATELFPPLPGYYLAWRFSPAESITVSSVDLPTGANNDQVEIWSDSVGAPGTTLASGFLGVGPIGNGPDGWPTARMIVHLDGGSAYWIITNTKVLYTCANVPAASVDASATGGMGQWYNDGALGPVQYHIYGTCP